MNFACKYTTRDFGTFGLSQYGNVHLKIAFSNPQILFICESVATSREAPLGPESTPQRHHKIKQGAKSFDFFAR